MIRTMHCAGLAAALLSPALAQAGAQPSQVELEAALLDFHVRVVTSPMACRDGPARGCMVPPRRIKVRNYDCQARGTDAEGGPILFCRVTFIQKGGSLAHVKSVNECVPLRARAPDSTDGGGTDLAWEVALIDAEGRCPGGRA